MPVPTTWAWKVSRSTVAATGRGVGNDRTPFLGGKVAPAADGRRSSRSGDDLEESSAMLELQPGANQRAWRNVQLAPLHHTKP